MVLISTMNIDRARARDSFLLSTFIRLSERALLNNLKTALGLLPVRLPCLRLLLCLALRLLLLCAKEQGSEPWESDLCELCIWHTTIHWAG